MDEQRFSAYLERQTEENRAIQILVAYGNLEDKHRLEIVNFHEAWKLGGTYGTNQYLKYQPASAEKMQLYRTTRNISNAQTPPNVPSNPQQYVLIG